MYKHRIKNIRLGSSMAKKILRVIVDHFESAKYCHSRRAHLFCSVQQVLGQDWGDLLPHTALSLASVGVPDLTFWHEPLEIQANCRESRAGQQKE